MGSRRPNVFRYDLNRYGLNPDSPDTLDLLAFLHDGNILHGLRAFGSSALTRALQIDKQEPKLALISIDQNAPPPEEEFKAPPGSCFAISHSYSESPDEHESDPSAGFAAAQYAHNHLGVKNFLLFGGNKSELIRATHAFRSNIGRGVTVQAAHFLNGNDRSLVGLNIPYGLEATAKPISVVQTTLFKPEGSPEISRASGKNPVFPIGCGCCDCRALFSSVFHTGDNIVVNNSIAGIVGRNTWKQLESLAPTPESARYVTLGHKKCGGAEALLMWCLTGTAPNNGYIANFLGQARAAMLPAAQKLKESGADSETILRAFEMRLTQWNAHRIAEWTGSGDKVLALYLDINSRKVHPLPNINGAWRPYEVDEVLHMVDAKREDILMDLEQYEALVGWHQDEKPPYIEYEERRGKLAEVAARYEGFQRPGRNINFRFLQQLFPDLRETPTPH